MISTRRASTSERGRNVDPYIEKKLAGKHITAVVGHFGSGKTEFSVSLAFALAREFPERIALVDLDIANPYFRSRELAQRLRQSGITVYGSSYGYEITAELPALDPAARAAFENPGFRVIVDVGGDQSGAKILNQYRKYLKDGEYELLCIINKNRPETSTLEGAISHINAIEEQTQLKITGLVSNAHFVTQTRADDVMQGYYFTRELSKTTMIPLASVCAPESLADEVAKQREKGGYMFDIMVLGLYMRPSWLDRKL